jgi:hypothetical protein
LRQENSLIKGAAREADEEEIINILSWNFTNTSANVNYYIVILTQWLIAVYCLEIIDHSIDHFKNSIVDI